MAKPTVPTREAIQEEMKKRLETDDKLKAWFQQFNKHSWDSFITSYSYSKLSAIEHPNLYKRESKSRSKVFNDMARESLEYIQQKKLFNLQCQWRAGSIELPFVQVAYDFQLFGEDVMNCPFLPPVEMDEVELFIQFLRSPDSSEHLEYGCNDWQDYDTFKEEMKTEEFSETPDWYEFYDGMRGTGYLMNLPDHKGIKEEYYREVYRDHENPRRHEPRAPDPEWDKPFMHASEVSIDFAKQFEDPELAETVINLIKTHQYYDNNEYLDGYLDYLKQIPETFPFVQHHDWRESLRLTVARYKAERIADALPRVWRQYIREVGDDREAYVNKRIANTSKDILKELDKLDLRRCYAGYVLEGRKLLGEPENFDY